MIRVLPILVELVLLVYCLIDCIQTPGHAVRNLPKWAWIVLVLVFPIVGGIAWLVAGRPKRGATGQVPWPSTRTSGFPEYERPSRPVAPDDDPAFLERLRHREEELRRRERAADEEEDGEEPRPSR